jgi:hypothetical protein
MCNKEALLLFANVKAIIRADKLGVLDHLIDASKRGALIRIITPIDKENSQVVKHLSEKAPDIKILNGGSSHSGLFIVDSTQLLRFELRDPKAEEFFEAIGFVYIQIVKWQYTHLSHFLNYFGTNIFNMKD